MPLIFMLLSLGLFNAFAQNFEVFQLEVKQIADEGPRTYLRSDDGGSLKPMEGKPVLLPNRVVLRRKYTGNKYGFYKGFLTENAPQELYHFSLGELEPIGALKLKFYTSPNEKAFMDVQDIYVDEFGLYHGTVPELWYNLFGDWKKLTSKGEKVSLLTIEGKQGVKVLRNGKHVGFLPFFSSPLSKEGDTWALEDRDFLTKALWVAPDEGTLQNRTDSLINTPQWTPQFLSNRSYIQDSSKEMIIIEEFYREALQEKAQLDSLRGLGVTELSQNYYPLERQLLNQTAYNQSYHKYLALRDSLMNVGADQAAILIDRRLNHLKKEISQIDTLLQTLWKRKFTRVIDPAALKFKIADSTKNELAMRIKFGFKDLGMPVGDGLWTGSALLDEQTLKTLQGDLKKGKMDSLTMELHWEAKPVRLGEGYNYQYFFYRFLDMKVFFGKNELPFIGNFELADKIEMHPEVQEWLKRDSLRVIRSKRIAEEAALREIERKKLEEKANQEALLEKIRGPVADLPGGKFYFKGNWVELSPFGINRIEVTQKHFSWVSGKNPSTYKAAQKPVHNISWDDANQFCREVGGKLPTEAQWEYAARASTKTYFYWGRREIDARPYAVFEDNSQDLAASDSLYGPQIVKGKKPNAWEIYDMAGNVSEWVKDYHTLWYMDFLIPDKDPEGPTLGGHFKVYKGGSWRDSKRMLEHTKSDWEDPRYWADELGFRCAFPYQQKMKQKEMENRIKLFEKRRPKTEPKVGEEVLPPQAQDSTEGK